MALVKPVVFGTNGLPQQLQSGDQILAAQAIADTRVLINGEASTTLVICMPVYISSAGTVKRAQANALSTGGVFGLVYDTSIAVSASGSVVSDGVLTATTAQWDSAVVGGSGGLVAGTYYFLDASSAGKLTATPPTTVGQCNVFIGQALNATDMELSVKLPVLL